MRTDKDIESLLSALDGARRAEAPPYLYSKLRNRLEASTSVLPRRLAWRLALVLLLIAALNVLTLRAVRGPSAAEAADARAIANEYAIGLPESY